MRAQIQALQDKIAKIEAQEQRRVAPAAAVEAGSRPKSWKLPGTNTSMNIGGFAILQFDYDLNGNSSYGPANARIDGTANANRQGNFDLNARQSRLFISTSTPTDWGDLLTHIEIDANGTGGEAGRSPEYSSGQAPALRLRKAYGKLGPVLAGQETTTFFVPGAGERTDVATPFLGGSAFRLGMVRYDHSFGGGTMLRVGIEDNIGINETAANASVLSLNGTTKPAGPAGAFGVGQALDETPAFVGQLSHAWSSGSAGVSFMARKVTIDNGGTGGPTGAALDDSTLSWGVGYGAGWIISKQFRVGAQGIYGKAMGMYSGGSPVLVTASGVASNTFEIDPVTTFGGAAFVQWRFTDTMRLNILYGREEYSYDGSKSDLTPVSPVAAGNPVDYTQQMAANIMWQPVPAVNIGLQYIYTIASINNSPNAKQSRLELAFRYSF